MRRRLRLISSERLLVRCNGIVNSVSKLIKLRTDNESVKKYENSDFCQHLENDYCFYIEDDGWITLPNERRKKEDTFIITLKKYLVKLLTN